MTELHTGTAAHSELSDARPVSNGWTEYSIYQIGHSEGDGQTFRKENQDRWSFKWFLLIRRMQDTKVQPHEDATNFNLLTV